MGEHDRPAAEPAAEGGPEGGSEGEWLHGIEIVRDPLRMQQRAQEAHRRGQRIAFVPTMGYLHDGHLSLLQQGRALGELLCLSIFVNPLQFGPREDLGRYPRDLDGDLRKAKSAGCDLAFLPTPETMYPPGFQTQVAVTQVEQGLCGAQRPGHFVGVATVVLKLCNLVQPDVMLLGEKDYQQLQVIRTMVRDLALPVQVVGAPLVRDSDGVALSSRNAYLSPAERQAARVLSRALFAAQKAYAQGERRSAELLAIAGALLSGEPALRLQYLELRDAQTLGPVPAALVDGAVLLVAGTIGTTRLIDNVVLRA
jgi:pantoate--beta-alanine ligase